MRDGLLLHTAFSAGMSGGSPAKASDPVVQHIGVTNYFKCEVQVQVESDLLRDHEDDMPVDPTVASYHHGSTHFERRKLLTRMPSRVKRLQGADPDEAKLHETPAVQLGRCPAGETSPYRVLARVTAQAARTTGGVLHPGGSHSEPEQRRAELFVK